MTDNDEPIKQPATNPPRIITDDPEATAHAHNHPETLTPQSLIPPTTAPTTAPTDAPADQFATISILFPDGSELLVPPSKEDDNKVSRFRPKRSKFQRENDFQITAELHLKGHSCREISEILSAQRTYTLSRSQIDNDVTEIHKRWEVKYGGKTHKVRLRELAKLDILEAEAWAAWKLSLRDGKDQMQISSPSPAGGAVIVKTVKSAKQRDGDARFLKVILDVSERKAKLLGLDKVDEAQVDYLKNLPPEHMENLRERFRRKILAEADTKSQNVLVDTNKISTTQ